MKQSIKCDVAIVGAGPTGLAAATRLKHLGVRHVVVLDREDSAGGIPRHCGHPPFGMREYRRILRGPAYADRLRQSADAAGVEIWTQSTVTAIEHGPLLHLSTPEGLIHVEAKRVLLATGVRETPRSARLVSGMRPAGVVTTGALQSMVYLKSRVPFHRPVIVGTELVSFSALLTCRHAEIRPVAMLESRSRPTAWRLCTWLPRLQGVRVFMNTELIKILGSQTFDSVVIKQASKPEEVLECDGIIFSGKFVSESTLVRMSHLDVDLASGGPITDQYGRCSDSRYFAAGNMLHPADSSRRCWQEGIAVADEIAHSLAGDLPEPDKALTIQSTGSAIRYFVPNRLVPGNQTTVSLQVRFAVQARGLLKLRDEYKLITSKYVRALPEKRVILRIPQQLLSSTKGALKLDFEPS